MEQDIFAWLNFLKANSRRGSVESVLDPFPTSIPIRAPCRGPRNKPLNSDFLIPAGNFR
jgi:hypothetical protein